MSESQVASSCEVLRWLDEEAFSRLSEHIAKIIAAGRIAVVVHEPHPEVLDGIAALGGGRSTATRVFALAPKRAKRLARIFSRVNDLVTAKWLKRVDTASTGRLYVCVHLGTLLVNYVEGEGFSIEPGSVDADFLN
jgi:hypothetical protein